MLRVRPFDSYYALPTYISVVVFQCALCTKRRRYFPEKAPTPWGKRRNRLYWVPLWRSQFGFRSSPWPPVLVGASDILVRGAWTSAQTTGGTTCTCRNTWKIHIQHVQPANQNPPINVDIDPTLLREFAGWAVCPIIEVPSQRLHMWSASGPINPVLLTPLMHEQNGRHVTDDIFRCIFMTEYLCFFIRILLTFVPKDPIDKKVSIASNNGVVQTRRQVMTWIKDDQVHWFHIASLNHSEFVFCWWKDNGSVNLFYFGLTHTIKWNWWKSKLRRF